MIWFSRQDGRRLRIGSELQPTDGSCDVRKIPPQGQAEIAEIRRWLQTEGFWGNAETRLVVFDACWEPLLRELGGSRLFVVDNGKPEPAMDWLRGRADGLIVGDQREALRGLTTSPWVIYRETNDLSGLAHAVLAADFDPEEHQRAWITQVLAELSHRHTPHFSLVAALCAARVHDWHAAARALEQGGKQVEPGPLLHAAVLAASGKLGAAEKIFARSVVHRQDLRGLAHLAATSPEVAAACYFLATPMLGVAQELLGALPEGRARREASFHLWLLRGDLPLALQRIPAESPLHWAAEAQAAENHGDRHRWVCAQLWQYALTYDLEYLEHAARGSL